MPPPAISNRPLRSARASVNAPRTWPNISLSKSVDEMPPRLTLTNGAWRRRLLRWMASATSSLPVPLSPVMRTDASVAATRPTIWRIRRRRGSLPITSPKSYRASSSSRVSAGSSSDPGRDPARPSAVRTLWRSCWLVHGLVTKSAAPAFMPRTASEIDPQAVRRMTGRSGRAVLSRAEQLQAFLAGRLAREVHVLDDERAVRPARHDERLVGRGGRRSRRSRAASAAAPATP